MESMVFGAGYVGLVQAAGLASTGNHITLADISQERIDRLRNGECPIHEPQLPELLEKSIRSKLIQFELVGSDAYLEAAQKAEIFFIAVQTPQAEDGSVNLDYVFSVVDQLAELEGDLKGKIIVTKSTVPVGTGDAIEERLRAKGKLATVASNPEFLKQGDAVQDFLKPERVIIGTEDRAAREKLSFLYRPYMLKKERILLMGRRSAELVKYACNTFLATKISFINEMSQLAETVGADIRDIRAGMISDSRIGDKFLFPGVGYGGSCFPKDTKGLIYQGEHYKKQMRLAKATDQVNQLQRQWAVEKLEQAFEGNWAGKKIAIWGLSFKPNTDDLREAPALELIQAAIKNGASILAYDPVAMENSKNWIGEEIKEGKVILCDDPYDCLEGASALAVMTEWHDFRSPNFQMISKKLNRPLLIDGRNLYGPEIAKEYGLEYFGVGIFNPYNLRDASGATARHAG